jgi:polyisoprenyl-teichoic acid--peptidoglycan teichoic acid transferase
LTDRPELGYYWDKHPMDGLRRKNTRIGVPAKLPESDEARVPRNIPAPDDRPARTQKKKTKKYLFYNFFLWLFSMLLLGGISYGLFFIYKTYSIGKKINVEISQDHSLFDTLQSMARPDLSNIRGSEDHQVNILLLGMAGKGKPGQNLTDTIMVASIDTKTDRVALLSIPRDLYVTIPDAKVSTKINSVYQYGLSTSQNDAGKAADAVEKTVSNITGLPIDYYVIMNFDGFEKVIDDIGGINVISERDIYDARYPGPNYSYETFDLKKGFHHLDGATALKYARERHDDPEGDFGRAKRQQQIMQAVKNKIFSAETLMNVFTINNLFDALGDNVKTDVPMDEFPSFFELARNLDTNNINNVVVDAWNKDSLLKVSHVQYGAIRAFVLIPRVGNYSEIHDLAANIFDLNKLKRRKEEISQESAGLAIIDQSGDPRILSRIKKVLQDNLDHKDIDVLTGPAKKITGKTVVYDTTDGQKPFTLDELAAKLPAEVSYSMDDGIAQLAQKKNHDMVIVIGKDLIERYNMEEDTMDDLNAAQDDQMYINLLDNK